MRGQSNDLRSRVLLRLALEAAMWHAPALQAARRLTCLWPQPPTFRSQTMMPLAYILRPFYTEVADIQPPVW